MKRIALFFALLIFTPLAQADQFVNGQAADVVLGQPDLVSSGFASRPDRFRGAWDVAIDPTTGKVFVADELNSRVLRFSSEAAARSGSSPEAVFGQPNFNSYSENQGTGAPAINTLKKPRSVEVDHKGRLWVSDTGNHRVLGWFAASFRGTGEPADYVFGQSDFESSATGNTASTMENPHGVCADEDDRLWVADRDNNRVLRFDNISAKANGAAADGVLGQSDFGQSGADTTASTMFQPYFIDVDDAGRLWVADRDNFRVLRFDDAGDKEKGADADGVLGQPDLTSFFFFGNDEDSFEGPYGVVVDDGGTLWVSDYFNNRVMGFPNAANLPNGAAATIVLGQPEFEARNQDVDARTVRGPVGLEVGPGGSLFVADYTFSRVLRFTPFPTPAAGAPPAAAALAALRMQLLSKAKKLSKKAKVAKRKGQATKAKKLKAKAKKLTRRARSI